MLKVINLNSIDVNKNYNDIYVVEFLTFKNQSNKMILAVEDKNCDSHRNMTNNAGYFNIIYLRLIPS